MKKILCALLTLCLLVPAALADETLTMNWETVVPTLEAANVTGQFYTFDEIAIKIWVPDGMAPVELSEEDKANGYIGYFMPDDQSAQMAIVYVNTNGASLEEYAQYLASEGDVTEVETGTVNGLPFVSYQYPAKDSLNVTFATEAGYLLEVSCAPLSVENAELVWTAVIASIQNAE